LAAQTKSQQLNQLTGGAAPLPHILQPKEVSYMLIADVIQMWILIVAIFVGAATIIVGLYSIWAAKRKFAVQEGSRDEKINTIIDTLGEMKKDLKNHRHVVYESRFDEYDGRCRLREQHIDNIVQTLGLRVETHLEEIKGLKEDVAPIAKIGANVELMTALLTERLGDLQKRMDKVEKKVFN